MSCGIYKITNTINGKTYIGQSSNIEERWKKHKYANDDFAIHKAMRKYGIENFTFSIVEECATEELNNREIYWINYYNSLEDGYNMIPGGSNGAGYAKGIPVEQYSLGGKYIATYDSAKQASEQTGIQHTDICKCCREQATRAGLYQWRYENSKKLITPIDIQVINIQRKVNQYTLNGQFVAQYETLAKASEMTGISKSIICNVCKKKKNCHTAGGFRWAYEGENVDLTISSTVSKKIYQYDKAYNLIAEYSSLTEASEKTGINRGNIGQVCNGKRKTAGNYIWKYKD